jgi:hypothetical protein
MPASARQVAQELTKQRYKNAAIRHDLYGVSQQFTKNKETGNNPIIPTKYRHIDDLLVSTFITHRHQFNVRFSAFRTYTKL